MHAFFADGIDNMHIPWAVEGLPTLLHLSLFLFFGGLVIFLFNVDQEVFLCVVWWIGLFTLVYGLITLLPLIRHNSPYYGPLSLPAWFLYSSIPYVTSTVLSFIAYSCGYYQSCDRYDGSRDRYRARMSGGVEKAAEEVVSERSSEIDGRILGWTISALGDDDSLEKFFEAIPGFFNSELVRDLERDFPETHLITFWGTMDGFMGRTLSSNSVTNSVKSRRVLICRDIMGVIPCPHDYVYNSLLAHFDHAPVSIERMLVMERWFSHSSHVVSDAARARVAKNLLRTQEFDDRWFVLASEVYYGMALPDIEDNVALGGDNLLLAILIHVSRQAIHSYKEGMLELVYALTQMDIQHTIPGLQHDFCTIWNELVEEARNHQHSSYDTRVEILRSIRLLYITLHQGTDAAPTAFSHGFITPEPSSFPFCDIASHRHRPHSIYRPPLLGRPIYSPDTSLHYSTSDGDSASQQAKEASSITRPSPPDSTTPSRIGDNSQTPATTSPVFPALTNPPPTDALSPGAVATALQNIPPTAPFSCPAEGTAQQDILAPYAELDISETMSTMAAPAPAPSLTPVSVSTQHVLNTSLTSCDAGAASASDPLIPALSVVNFPTPSFPPPPRVPPFPKTLSSPSDNTTPPRLRARGLVNSGNIFFANALLLLVHSPPFWDLFRELSDLKGQRGAGGLETGGSVTSLVDATVRFSEEFIFKDKEPPQQVAGGKLREDEEAKKEHNSVDSFEPTYMYDAMKEKRQLKKLLVRSRSQNAFLCY
jgi:Family of unknown function (DUF6535)